MPVVTQEIKCDDCGAIPETVRSVGVVWQGLDGWLVKLDMGGGEVATLCPACYLKLLTEHGRK